MDAITKQIAELMPAVDAELGIATYSHADGDALATWTVGKSEKVKSAFTERAYMAAPKKTREADAYAKTRAAVFNGRYIGFTRDFEAALSKAHRVALDAHFSAVFSAADGRPVKGDSTMLATLPSVNKALFRTIAEFAAAPRATIKKIEQPKPLPKSAQWMTQLAQEWIAANPA